MAKLQDRAKDRAGDVKPYLERALKDERVREDVKSAIATARDAIDDLRDAADRIQGKTSHGTRNATLLLTGIALGILFNPVTGPGTRRWVQEKIFGEGDEFEYRQDNAK
jgi:hypothetical protein